MKKLVLGFLMTLCACTLYAKGNPVDDILNGKWWTGPKKEAQIAFFHNAGDTTFCAKLIWMMYPDNPDGTPVLDVKNPDRELRQEPMLGMVLIDTLTYSGNGQWFTRRMYVPENGMYVRAVFTMESDGNLGLRVSKLGIVVNKTFVRVPSGT